MLNTKIAARLAALASVVLLSLSACGGGSDDPPPPPNAVPTGIVSGKVADAASGEAIAGVEVRIGTLTATSDASGNYTLQKVPVSPQAVAQFSKPSYASNFATVEVTAGKTYVANRRLAKVGVRTELSAAAGGTVTLAGSPAQVQLPAAGLVTAGGASYTGTVTVEMTPIDPSVSPLNMPGNFRVEGESLPIESMGALQVELRDANGAALNLAPGKTATIRIPVPSGATSPPLSMPLYYFKESTGLWVREGAATLAGTLPQQYYEGTVSHFTVWNADKPMETILIKGCVVDKAGKPLDATVTSNGIDYFGSASVRTLEGGLFEVPARINSRVEVSAMDGLDSAAVIVTTGTTNLTLPACIVIDKVKPTIITQPESITIGIGGFGSLSVVAINALEYEWYRNGVLIASGSRFLPFVNVAGTYHVVVKNQNGSVTSNTVTVTVTAAITPPVIVTQPQPATALVGASASFTVVAQGPALRYQWLRNGGEIAGATGATLDLGAVALADDDALFSVRVSNNGGSVLSDSARLDVTTVAVAPSITRQPSAATVAAGQSATFAVEATGTGPLSYQWLRAGMAIANATSATYQTPATTLADSGTQYTVRVTNTKGSVLSAIATLTVTPSSTVPGLHLSFPHGAAVNGKLGWAAIPVAGGTVVPLVPAGQIDLPDLLYQGQIVNGMVSNIEQRSLLYWRNSQLFRRDLFGNSGLPAEARVSNLTSAGVCNVDTSYNGGFTPTGNDFADSSRSWKIIQKAGPNNECDTDDDVFQAVRVNQGAGVAPLTVLRPIASINNAQGVLTGWLLRNGQTMQRVNADFSNPVNLFTLPASDIGSIEQSGVDGNLVFVSGSKVYAVDMSAPAPATLHLVATLAEEEGVGSTDFANAKDVVVSIGSPAATRVVRFDTVSKQVNTVGTLTGVTSVAAVTPTRVVLRAGLGAFTSFPLGGGQAQNVYTPPTPGFSILGQRGGERMWFNMGTSLVTVKADGSGLQTLANTQVFGCFVKASAALSSQLLECDAVLVLQGNVLRSLDAVTAATRVTYGTITLPAAPLTSAPFNYSLTSWGQSAVISQVIFDPDNAGAQAVANYFIKTDQPGITPIALP